MKRQQKFRNSKATQSHDVLPFARPAHRRVDHVLTAKTENQKRYLQLILTNTLTFGTGPAGTGKTFIAAWLAADALEKGTCEKLYITRPIVEAGESIGFLPGELEEKVAPYFAPIYEALVRRLGSGKLEYMVKAKQIEFVPLAFMRGRTFDNAWVLADEMQNATPKQMKMLLTRVGENTKIIVNGDLKQSDIPGPSGLADAIERLVGNRDIALCIFCRDDVVRSGLARVIVDAYEGEQALPSFITGNVDTFEERA